MSDRPHLLAFDLISERPGCVLLQAAYGGNVADFDLLFPVECWTLSPTNVQRYALTDQELDDASRAMWLRYMGRERPGKIGAP